MTETLQLIPCGAAGRPQGLTGALPDILRQHCEASAALYARIGYRPPWVSYVACAGPVPVGGGAFVGAPPRRDRLLHA